MDNAIPKIPKQGKDLIQSTLWQISRNAELNQAILNYIVPQELRISEPLPVYMVGLQDVAKSQLLSKAFFTGWRYLASEKKAIATIDLVENEQHQFVVAGISVGSLVEAFVSTQEYAASLPEFKTGQWEMRLLQVPALYMIMFWLHDFKDFNNILIPMMETYQELKLRNSYREADVINVLKEAADHY